MKVSKMAAPSLVNNAKSSAPDKYDIERWTSTIQDAMEILNDPKKMKHVTQAMGKKHAAINSFAALREKIEGEPA